MFWNNFRFPRTVKFRIAAFYAVVFTVSSLCSFLLVYWFQYSSQILEADRTLKECIRRLEREYLSGGEFRPGCRLLTFASIPGKMREAIARKFSGMKLLLAFRNESDGSDFVACASGDSLYLFEWKSASESISYRDVPMFERTGLLKPLFLEESYGEGQDRLFFLLISPEGRVLARSPIRETYFSLFEQQFKRLPDSAVLSMTSREGGRALRLSCRRLFDGNWLMTGYNLKRIDLNMKSLALLFAVVELLLLLTGSLTGWFLAKHFTRGVDRVRRTATMIAAGDFSLRVAHGNEGEEIDNLVDSFNTMTGNTERLLRELKTMSDDIAHDLRTPVTRLRGMAELAISRGRETELAYDVAEECGNMLGMINTMLKITRAESGIRQEKREEVNLSELLSGVVDLFSSFAEDSGVSLILHLPEKPVFLVCPKVNLQRVFANLLDNALKFTPSGGTVTVSLTKSLTSVIFSVEDTGCGISYEDQQHVFERFYRADSSRSLPGNGLGLSLVEAVVKSCGGGIRLKSRPGKGSCFTVTLPLSANKTEKEGGS